MYIRRSKVKYFSVAKTMKGMWHIFSLYHCQCRCLPIIWKLLSVLKLVIKASLFKEVAIWTLQVSSKPICHKRMPYASFIRTKKPLFLIHWRCTSRLIRNRVIPTTSSVSKNTIIYHCLNGRPIAKLAPLYEVLSSITTASLIQTIHMIINLHVDCTHSITSHHSDVPRNWCLLCVFKRFFEYVRCVINADATAVLNCLGLVKCSTLTRRGDYLLLLP